LIVKYSSKVLPVREDISLMWEIGTARINEIYATGNDQYLTHILETGLTYGRWFS
jgi:hypothetical protein